MKLGVSLRPLRAPRLGMRGWLAVGGVAVACGALAGWHAAGRGHGAAAGQVLVAKVVHGGAEAGTGVVAVAPGGRRWDVAEGARVAWGTRLETSPATRVRVELDDGTAIAMDRATVLEL